MAGIGDKLKAYAKKASDYVSTIGDSPADTAKKASDAAAAKQNKEDTDTALGKGTDTDLSKLNTGIIATRGTQTPSYHKGTPFVPKTGPAILKRGETVLPAQAKNKKPMGIGERLAAMAGKR